MATARCDPSSYGDYGNYSESHGSGYDIEFGGVYDQGYSLGHLTHIQPQFTDDYDISHTSHGKPRIVDIATIGDDLIVMIETVQGYAIEKLSIPVELPDVRNAIWMSSDIASLEMDKYRAISNGVFGITINDLHRTITGLNFNMIGSRQQIATVIQAGLRSEFGSFMPECRLWRNRLLITSGTETEISSVGLPTEAASGGTNIATAALMGTPGASFPASMPFPVLLDGKREVQGVYSDDLGQTIWNYGWDDCSVDTIVLGRDFGAQAGSLVTTVRLDPRRRAANGDWTSGTCWMGRSYRMRIRLSRPHPRQEDGTAILDGQMTINELILDHRETADYRLEIAVAGRDVRSEQFSAVQANVFTLGQFATEDGATSYYGIGDADEAIIDIVSDSPLPVTIPQIQYEVDYERRRP